MRTDPQAAASPAPGPVLRASNLHRVLGTGEAAAHAVRGVSLVVERGEYVSLVGASGCGKSTLLYLLGGLDRPSTSDVSGRPFEPASEMVIDGERTRDLGDAELALLRNEKVGFVFQFHYLLKEFTAQENVALPMFKRGMLSRGAALERAAGLLKRLGLGQKVTRPARRLSGGEQQRVALARALANEPAVVLADEPTGNLDSRNSGLVSDMFDELAAGGQTIVLATHDRDLASRTRRRLTMHDGQIVGDEAAAGRSRSAPGQ